MPESKHPLKVFLCHAHADRDAVRALYTRLTNDGVDAWLDKEKLLPGQDWELEIKKAVREADVVVVCLSKQFNQRGFRQKEVRLALDTAIEQPEGEIFIIPARLEECDTLDSLRKWHWVDLFEEDGYESLIRALHARANKLGVKLLTKRDWLPRIAASHFVKKQSDESKRPKGWKKKTGDGTRQVLEKEFVDKTTIETSKPKVEIHQQRNTKLLRKPITAIAIALFVLSGITIAGFLNSHTIRDWFVPTLEISITSTPTLTLTAAQTKIPALTIVKSNMRALASNKSIRGSAVSIAWSPTGDYFATVSDDGDVSLWDAAGNRKDVRAYYLISQGEEVRDQFVRLAYDPNGRYLAAASNFGHVSLFDIENLSLPLQNDVWLTDNLSYVYIYDVVFSKDGRLFATASDGVVRVWDVNQRKVLRRIELDSSVSVDMSLDDTTLAVGGEAGQIMVFNMSDYSARCETNASGRIQDISISKNGTMIAAIGTGKLDVKIIDATNCSQLFEVDAPSNEGSRYSFVSFIGDDYVIAGGDGFIIWKLFSDSILQVTSYNETEGGHFAVSPDGTSIVLEIYPWRDAGWLELLHFSP